MSEEIILLIEDNIAILEANRRVLSKRGYSILSAMTLKKARELLSMQLPDVIVLDIMMPDGNGLAFIKEIREFTMAPILVLTSLAEKDQRIQGLRDGGDDYITKPYDVDELSERIAAFLRREKLLKEMSQTQNTIILGPLKLDLTSSLALIHNKDIQLTQREFSLLSVLVKEKGKVLSTEVLYQRIWKQPMITDANALKVAISRLRKKLIHTDFDIISVRGEGYVFEI